MFGSIFGLKLTHIICSIAWDHPILTRVKHIEYLIPMKKSWLTFILTIVVLPLMAFAKHEDIAPPKDKFIVVLDAGHGGHDPGNLGNGFLEKAIALNIVLRAGEVLEKKPDIEVIYTRKTDHFVGLYQRGQIANRANADLFVSVHCDSHNSDAEGAGTFVLGLHANKHNFEVAKKENSVIYLEEDYKERYAKYDIDSPESIIGLTIMQEEFLDQSILLGKKLQDNFSSHLKRKDRKVKQAGFIVLHQTFMPSVLIETGFLTNKAEGDYLNSDKGQREMGKAIANAILAYKADISNGFEPQQITLEEAPEVTPTEVVVATTPHQHGPETPHTPNHDVVTFRVQFLASSKNLPLQATNFRGLDNLSKEPYKNLYRYMCGNTTAIKYAQLLKNQARAKGYSTAYIVAYKDGQRIPMPEILE